MSQAALAAAMRERGRSWGQATVWAVESGKRALKLSEAEDLAGVLDVDLHELTRLPLEPVAAKALEMTADIGVAVHRAIKAMQTLGAAQREGLQVLDEIRAAGVTPDENAESRSAAHYAHQLEVVVGDAGYGRLVEVARAARDDERGDDGEHQEAR